MTAAPDLTAATAAELAELLGVTPRRIRQLFEEGRLVKRGRGTYDMTHAILGNLGGLVLGQDRRRGVPAHVVAAVGWLSCFIGKLAAPVTPADLAVWRASCARWGCTADQAVGFLAAGAALLADRAPKFGPS